MIGWMIVSVNRVIRGTLEFLGILDIYAELMPNLSAANH